jgi:hypothetical protein
MLPPFTQAVLTKIFSVGFLYISQNDLFSNRPPFVLVAGAQAIRQSECQQSFTNENSRPERFGPSRKAKSNLIGQSRAQYLQSA